MDSKINKGKRGVGKIYQLLSLKNNKAFTTKGLGFQDRICTQGKNIFFPLKSKNWLNRLNEFRKDFLYQEQFGIIQAHKKPGYDKN